ncbi:MAG: HD domain-containing protein [Desulfovibrionaceae bacterium]
MAKNLHEFRDPVHGFITCSSKERAVINSRPFQRLRHIHHLATSFLVYPGATHRRFEHSLGVMELATKIYDVLTDSRNLMAVDEKTGRSIPEISDDNDRRTYRIALRMAALCHDLGHIPFSHGAEELLPGKTTHEHLTWKLILSDEMAPFWKALNLDPSLVAKLAVGRKEAAKIDGSVAFSVWDTIVSEIIVGEAFGADRMDYLLRDSLHTGVSYGRFDHQRLISTLRILPSAIEDDVEGGQTSEPAIGVEVGGLQAAESLVMARYLMFSQVYCHHVRRIYDIHLREFMELIYPEGLPVEHEEFLNLTDNEILVELRLAADDPGRVGHEPARRLMKRGHYKKVYQLTNDDRQKCDAPLKALQEALIERYGSDNVRIDDYGKKTQLAEDFPVWVDDRSVYVRNESQLLRDFPPVSTDYLFVEPELFEKARDWVDANREAVFKRAKKGEMS